MPRRRAAAKREQLQEGLQADVRLQAPRPYPKSRLPSEARTVPRLAKYVTSR